MISPERSSSDLSEYTLYKIKEIFVYLKIQFLGEKLKNYVICLQFFFKIFPKFSDFINSDLQNVSENSSKSIRLQPVFIEQKQLLKLIKRGIFFLEKK